jgi:hypothetical protein
LPAPLPVPDPFGLHRVGNHDAAPNKERLTGWGCPVERFIIDAQPESVNKSPRPPGVPHCGETVEELAPPFCFWDPLGERGHHGEGHDWLEGEGSPLVRSGWFWGPELPSGPVRAAPAGPQLVSQGECWSRAKSSSISSISRQIVRVGSFPRSRPYEQSWRYKNRVRRL